VALDPSRALGDNARGMAIRSNDPLLRRRSPARIFVAVLLLVFAAEGAIMLLLPLLPARWRDPMLAGVLDAGALTLLIAPAVWWLAVMPLRRSYEARGLLLRRFFADQERERARVARDLHDGVGQHLTALLVGLRALEDGAASAPDRTPEAARALREIAALAHAEVRGVARALRPALLAELGLVAALERLCEDAGRDSGVEVTLRCDDAVPRLSEACETALYRIAQEALANVSRHAAAKHARVSLVCDGDDVTLSIADDGCGFVEVAGADAAGRDGFGLGSMRERTRLLGGTLRVRSRPGDGATIEARIPVAREAQRLAAGDARLGARSEPRVP